MSSQQAGTVIQAQGEPQCEVIKRTLCVHICGSLTNLAMAGPQVSFRSVVLCFLYVKS